ncbi:DNA cytosine methyltransferase [Paenibacillus sp. Leaf72]|uniref:DNA cytosine methyltransferase n=1 Tax=Paenibacillus sp. Leaf72 TaxID=1736234 RepID=UPI001F3CE58A|nr:DNA (cytosine-5-)-methyltransferase [Paenibacillus sp. Leaf72]
MQQKQTDSNITNTLPPLNKSRNFSVVSYFSGCGGLDLGIVGGFLYKDKEYSKLPFQILGAYDHDIKCIDTYKANIGDHAKKEDLSEADPSTMPAAEVLIGGFPCQDFSSCGPQGGLATIRGQMYKAMIRYMNHHKPKLVIGENVPHLAKMGGGSILETILTDFRDAGYRFEVWTMQAKDYGVPQGRVRLIFVGVREDLEGFPVMPTPTNEVNSIEWAIGDLINITDDSVPNQSQFFKANKAKKGNGQGDEANRADEPAYTIRANAKSRVHFHYKLERRLTVRECARIQTFPDSFVFAHSKTSSIMQIGNAVPPVLAHHVGTSIADYLQNIAERKDTRD